jgi:hypothetical protein
MHVQSAELYKTSSTYNLSIMDIGQTRYWTNVPAKHLLLQRKHVYFNEKQCYAKNDNPPQY